MIAVMYSPCGAVNVLIVAGRADGPSVLFWKGPTLTNPGIEIGANVGDLEGERVGAFADSETHQKQLCGAFLDC